MFSTLNLKLDEVELIRVSATHTPQRRSMKLRFSPDEFSHLLDQVLLHRLNDKTLQTFCDKFATLDPIPLHPEYQTGNFETPKTVAVLHFKETGTETLTRHYTLTGVIEAFDIDRPIPNDAVFTPLLYSDHMIMNDNQYLPGNRIEFYPQHVGFHTPLATIQPGYLIDKRIVDELIIEECECQGELTPLTQTEFSLHEHISPSTYLYNVLKAALATREYVQKNQFDALAGDLGIHDWTRYLIEKEACTFSSPLLFLLNREYTGITTLGNLRAWFPDFDDVSSTIVPPRADYFHTTPFEDASKEEVMLQELTLSAMAEMAKYDIRELWIKSNDQHEWIPSLANPHNRNVKNTLESAQKVCERLHQQFFTKHAELLHNTPLNVDFKFNLVGVSAVQIKADNQSDDTVKSFAFPSYDTTSWSPMKMPKSEAFGLADFLYQHVNAMILE